MLKNNYTYYNKKMDENIINNIIKNPKEFYTNNELTVDYLYLLLIHSKFLNTESDVLHFLNNKKSLGIIKKILEYKNITLPKCIIIAFYFGLHILKRSHDINLKNDLLIHPLQINFYKIQHVSFHNEIFLLILESLKNDYMHLEFFKNKFNKKFYNKIISSFKNSFKLLCYVKNRLYHYDNYSQFFQNTNFEDVDLFFQNQNCLILKNQNECVEEIIVQNQNLPPKNIGIIGDTYYYSKNIKDIYGTLKYLGL